MAESNAKGRKMPARKGFSGALVDAVEAVSRTVAPRPIRDRASQIEPQVSPERYRRNQTTDSNN